MLSSSRTVGPTFPGGGVGFWGDVDPWPSARFRCISCGGALCSQWKGGLRGEGDPWPSRTRQQPKSMVLL